jgi:hypothetical protein
LLTGQQYFVVTELMAPGNGHVDIDVGGWAHEGFPKGCWGSLGKATFAGADQSLTLAWIRTELAKVSYFALPPAFLKRLAAQLCR